MNNNRLVTKYFKITMSIVFIIAFLLLTLLFYNNEFMTKDFKNNISAVIITHDPAISYHYNVIVIDLNFGNSEELASDLPSGYTNATKTNIGLWNDISNDSEYATILTGISDLISSEENCYMLYCYDSYNSEASTSSIYGNIYMNYDLSYNSGIVNLPFQTLSNYHAHLSGFKNVKNDSALTTTINLNNETKAFESTNSLGTYRTYKCWVLQAQWSNDTYDIALDTNGGNTTSEVINVESSVPQQTSVSIPTRAGYNFNGYFTQATGGTQYVDKNGNILTNLDYSSPITTLYAQWTEIMEYTLTLNVNLNENANLMVLIYNENNFYRSIVFTNSSQVVLALPKNNTYKIAFAKTFVGQIKVNDVTNYGLMTIEISNTEISTPILNVLVTSNTNAVNKIIV